ncbi:ATP-binding cassette domain-containing protein [Nocardioides sp.]|uniref:ATP-binding cassette domain-containing protein n=1 Tax=Nocardioides sp. TaxID=35761 RepID=UPI002C24866C|nr:ATP-binding cassette domain-containing protein [Nocardioides sp.]HVX53392.1 ATP-binding cassette domain-containing protein [Nocardioides sp.]
MTIANDEFTSGAHEAVLTLEGITKHFGGVTALAGASFNVAAGRVLGLLGHNGAGKSTLVRIISGVQQPDAGRLLWRGRPVQVSSPAHARRLGIATVFQELALADDLDATANIFLNRELAWGWGPVKVRREREMRRRAVELLDRFAINLPPGAIDVRSMSGGQRQGVAIARALAGGSDLLLLDEPTAALGVRETRQVEDLILRLRDHGSAVLLVSHDLEQILKVCDDIVVFRRGHQVGLHPRHQLTKADVVSLIVGGEG